MEGLVKQIAESAQLTPGTVRGLLWSLTIVITLVVLGTVLRRIIRKRVDDERVAFHWRRLVTYLLFALGVLLLIKVWGASFRNLGTFFGLLTAGLAVAMGDVLKDIAGWGFILFRRPYRIGDRIEVDGHMGDVIDIRLFSTFIAECGHWVGADQSTGRIMILPNGLIFKEPVANFTRGFDHIWDEIPVLVTFESDWKLAKKILAEIVSRYAEPWTGDAQRQIRRTAREHLLYLPHLTPIVYTSVHDSGVLLTMRYLTPARQRRSNQEKLWEAVLDAFALHDDIDFAYPTQRAYFNAVEGKPGARTEIPALSDSGSSGSE